MADKRATLKSNHRLRRRFLTWTRMFRYGANNFSRNAWLTTAATAVMSITLLIIFMTFVARQALVSTVEQLRDQVDYSVFLRSDVTESEVLQASNRLKSVDNVRAVEYTSTSQARATYIRDKNPSAEQLQLISELETNPFSPSFKIIVEDPSNTKSLETAVEQDSVIKGVLSTNPKQKPTFSGDKRQVIETINGWADLAQQGGLVAGVLFIAISMLIIFNTIRMAIFNRKEEIQMMKLIGADKSFIRGPFVVEAIMYGFIAALVATGLGYTILYYAQKPLSNWGVAVGPLLENLILFAPLVLLTMITIGSIIGVVSSRLAVRRYLRV